jgi:phosphoglycolate phosphatase
VGELPRARAGALVFDLDGTLIDSRQDIATAVNCVRAELGREALSIEAVRGMVGEGVRLLLERALGVMPPAGFEAAYASYLRHYDRVCLDTTKLYPGIADLIERAAGRLPLAVLTNKPERMSRRILEHLGMLRHLRVVVGGDTLPVRKPDPQTLDAVAQALDLDRRRLLLVGDSLIDAETARAAGCGLVLVSWGFRPRRELEAAGAPICDDAADLAVRLGLEGRDPSLCSG